MQISVVICTWNRSKLLTRALQSLTTQRLDTDLSWQVIVVNNNSTDETDAVVASYASKLPIKLVHEPAPGLSHARNRALSEATGDYIIWTDDDVRVSAGWLQAYVRAFGSWPRHDLFGGPILPDFEGKPPNWLVSIWKEVETSYAIRDLGSEERELSAAESCLPFGANYAIRTDLQRLHPYDPVLGRSPTNMFLGGEETAMMRTIMSYGSLGRWIPDATVLHWVPKSRQTIRYIRNYWKGYGRYDAMTKDLQGTPTLFGLPRWAVRSYIEHELRYRVGRLRGSPEAWIRELKSASVSAGVLSYAIGRKHEIR